MVVLHGVEKSEVLSNFSEKDIEDLLIKSDEKLPSLAHSAATDLRESATTQSTERSHIFRSAPVQTRGQCTHFQRLEHTLRPLRNSSGTGANLRIEGYRLARPLSAIPSEAAWCSG